LPDARELGHSSFSSGLGGLSSQANRVSFAPYLMVPFCAIATVVVAITHGAVISLIFAFSLMFMCFAYYHFAIAMLLMIFLLPFDLQRNLGGDHALFADLAKLLLILPFLLIRPYRKSLAESRLCKFFLSAFLFNVAISLGRAIDLPLTAKLLLRQFSAVFFGLMVAVVFRSKEKLTRATAVVLAMIVIQGVYGAYQWMTGGLGSFWYWLNPEIATFTEWEGRAMGALGHMNSLGGVLNMGLCLALSLLVSRQWTRWRLRLCLGAAVMLIGLLVTFSRGGWFALALTAVLLFLIEFRRNRRLILAPVLLALLLLPIAKTELGAQVYRRVTTIEPMSDYTRLAADATSLQLFLQHPLLGVGYGNWRFFFSDYAPDLEQLPFAHNLYLGILAETGLVGFLLFFVPLGYLIAKGLRFPMEGDLVVATLIRACSLAMIGAFVQGLSDSWVDANPPYAGLFWTIVGMLISGLALAAKYGNGRSRVLDSGIGDLKPA
jgi:putative inorganic carbon (HCO3(-)) transporter